MCRTRQCLSGWSVLLALTVFLPQALGSNDEAHKSYELELSGGRVIDPESGLDAVRDVAIADGRIVAVSKESLRGDTVVDVTGLVVAPGFIDLHAHAQMPMGQHFAVHEGVTTALELEAGSYPVQALGTHEPFAIEDKALINFGCPF